MSKYTSEMDETDEAESQPPVKTPIDKQARQQIDQEVWRSAKPKLKNLIQNFGQNKYVSNTCSITSVCRPQEGASQREQKQVDEGVQGGHIRGDDLLDECLKCQVEEARVYR